MIVADKDKRRSNRIKQLPAPAYNLDDADRSLRWGGVCVARGVWGAGCGQVGAAGGAGQEVIELARWGALQSPCLTLLLGRGAPLAHSRRAQCTAVRTPRRCGGRVASTPASRGRGGSNGGWCEAMGDCSLAAAEAATEAALAKAREIKEQGRAAEVKVRARAARTGGGRKGPGQQQGLRGQRRTRPTPEIPARARRRHPTPGSPPCDDSPGPTHPPPPLPPHPLFPDHELLPGGGRLLDAAARHAGALLPPRRQGPH
jgi:hypothetical protein